MIGLAMTPEEMSSLHDIFMSYIEDTKTEHTSYILQFLWRDFTSPFDIIGLYFTSSRTFKAKHIIGHVYETVKVFELYGFHTLALVCDGAGPNLAAIKCMTSVASGAYGADSKPGEGHKIPSPCFTNPFNPLNQIHWVICPSHQVRKQVNYALHSNNTTVVQIVQLKNLINALFSSRDGGTKQFDFDGTRFGWKAIRV